MSALPAAHQAVDVMLYADFDDPALSPMEWQRAASLGSTWTVFQERDWQVDWWNTYGRGDLVIAVAYVSNHIIAIAPLFIDGNMAFFVGSGGSDYLDFIGNAGGEGVMAALLGAVLDRHPKLLGMRFYHVPGASGTAPALKACADRLGLLLYEEGSHVAPVLDMGEDGCPARDAASKKSLVRHERLFSREGPLSIRHLSAAREILPHLDSFFVQHEQRWSRTPSPSLFNDRANRSFYTRLSERADSKTWLRFTVVEWESRPIAYHFGFSHRGRYLWYKPSFDISLARRSPGEVLLRHLLLAAAAERARVFDFGLGDEAFKYRFATHSPVVYNWALYPGG